MIHGPAYATRWTRRRMRVHLEAHHIIHSPREWVSGLDMAALHRLHEGAHQRGDLMPDHRDMQAQDRWNGRGPARTRASTGSSA